MRLTYTWVYTVIIADKIADLKICFGGEFKKRKSQKIFLECLRSGITVKSKVIKYLGGRSLNSTVPPLIPVPLVNVILASCLINYICLSATSFLETIN